MPIAATNVQSIAQPLGLLCFLEGVERRPNLFEEAMTLLRASKHAASPSLLYGNHRGFGSPETHPKVILFPTADLWTYFSPFAWQNSPARATAASIAVWPEDVLKTPDEATRLSPTP